MNDTIIVALISFAGTLVGTLAGIMASAKLTTYRIEQLEKKVDKHNNFAERIPLIEQRLTTDEEKLGDLEQYHK